jgi:hypothetical protein
MCYCAFQSAVLVAIRVAKFQSVTTNMGAVTAEVALTSLNWSDIASLAERFKQPL